MLNTPWDESGRKSLSKAGQTRSGGITTPRTGPGYVQNELGSQELQPTLNGEPQNAVHWQWGRKHSSLPGETPVHNHPQSHLGRGRGAIFTVKTPLAGDRSYMGLTGQTIRWGDQLFQFFLDWSVSGTVPDMRGAAGHATLTQFGGRGTQQPGSARTWVGGPGQVISSLWASMSWYIRGGGGGF